MKKFLSLALVLLILMSSTSALAAVTPPGTLPITDEPAELTIWAAPSVGQDDYDICKMTLWFEEMTGVHINWIQVSNSERNTLFNTSIASNDHPDIYMFPLSGADYLQYAADGVLIPLEDLIDKYGYYLKAKLEENPDLKQQVTAPDGHIYGMPFSRYAYANSLHNKMWVYKEWLDRYMQETGSESPDTPEELRDMLAFFRDNDMNGNGDTTDEIVMTGNYNYGSQGGNPLYYLLNAFAFVPSFPSDSMFFYIDENGQFTTDADSDALRDGLRYVHGLYDEGLFPEEIFVQDLNTMRSLTTTTKDNVIVATAGAPYSQRLLNAQSGVENAVNYTDYVPLNPLKHADGTVAYPDAGINFYGMSNFVTSSCENPELAIRWLDFIYSEEAQYYYTYFGVEGEDWEWVDSPSLGGDEKSIRIKLDAEQRLANAWNGSWCGVFFQTKEMMMAEEAATSAYVPNWNATELYLAAAKSTNVPRIAWPDDEDLAVEYTELHTLIMNYIMNAWSEFVLGTRDIDSDSDWNAYVDQLREMGLEDLKSLGTEYYN